MPERQTPRSLLSPDRKIITCDEAGILSDRLKKEGKKVVFTNGVFDIIHAGHAAYLMEARKLGDFLFVGINSDSSVRRIKGERRPIVREQERTYLMASFFFVDRVTMFQEDTPLELISAIEPDILVKGEDWEPDEIVGGNLVLAQGGEVKRVPLVEGLSTSKIIEKIVKAYTP